MKEAFFSQKFSDISSPTTGSNSALSRSSTETLSPAGSDTDDCCSPSSVEGAAAAQTDEQQPNAAVFQSATETIPDGTPGRQPELLQSHNKRPAASYSEDTPVETREVKRHQCCAPPPHTTTTPSILQQLIDQLAIQQAQLLDIQDTLVELRSQLETAFPPQGTATTTASSSLSPPSLNPRWWTEASQKQHPHAGRADPPCPPSSVHAFEGRRQRTLSSSLHGSNESSPQTPSTPSRSVEWAEIFSVLQNLTGTTECAPTSSAPPAAPPPPPPPPSSSTVAWTASLATPPGAAAAAAAPSVEQAHQHHPSPPAQTTTTTDVQVSRNPVEPSSLLDVPVVTNPRGNEGLPPGVWYDRVENRYVVQCNETTACGRKKRRYFGVSRYGEDGARRCAIRERLKIMGIFTDVPTAPQQSSQPVSRAASSNETRPQQLAVPVQVRLHEEGQPPPPPPPPLQQPPKQSASSSSSPQQQAQRPGQQLQHPQKQQLSHPNPTNSSAPLKQQQHHDQNNRVQQQQQQQQEHLHQQQLLLLLRQQVPQQEQQRRHQNLQQSQNAMTPLRHPTPPPPVKSETLERDGGLMAGQSATNAAVHHARHFPIVVAPSRSQSHYSSEIMARTREVFQTYPKQHPSMDEPIATSTPLAAPTNTVVTSASSSSLPFTDDALLNDSAVSKRSQDVRETSLSPLEINESSFLSIMLAVSMLNSLSPSELLESINGSTTKSPSSPPSASGTTTIRANFEPTEVLTPLPQDDVKAWLAAHLSSGKS